MIALTSSIDRFEKTSSLRWWGLMLLYAVILIVGVYVFVRFVARKTFLLDLELLGGGPANLGAIKPADNLVILRPLPQARTIEWKPNLFGNRWDFESRAERLSVSSASRSVFLSLNLG